MIVGLLSIPFGTGGITTFIHKAVVQYKWAGYQYKRKRPLLLCLGTVD